MGSHVDEFKGRKYKLSEGENGEAHKEDNTNKSCRNNLWCFVVSFGIAALFTQTLSSYISSQVTALQKQYDMSSSTVGIILGCNDFGFLATVLFASYFGHRGHIPKILAGGALLFGVSGIITALCYFINPLYLPTSWGDLSANGTNKTDNPRLCGFSGGHHRDKKCEEEDKESGISGNTLVLWILGMSMVLQGVAKAPRVSLSTTYVDDNAPKKSKTSLYMGSILTITLFGPAGSTILGGLFRRLPVDLRETTLTPDHPDWVGCWWLGFLMFGVISLFAGLPLLAFPKSMRDKEDNSELQQEEKVKSEEKVKPSDDVAEKKTLVAVVDVLKGLPLSIFRVVRQPVYTLTLVGIIIAKFGISGDVHFSPKYVEHQFFLPAYKANLIVGSKKIIGATIGTFLGGVVTSKLKLGTVGCLRFLVVVKLFALGAKSLNLFFGCENPTIFGLDQEERTMAIDDGVTICNCSRSPFFPVCGANATNFFSPCFAGCTVQTADGLSGCRRPHEGVVVAGLCPSDCPWLYYFLSADLVASLATTLGVMPAFLTLIRNVDEADRSVAMGLMTFMSSLLAFLPGPIIYGGVIDTTCLVWKEKCGNRGACAHYDIVSLRYRFKGLMISVLGAAMFFFVGALIFATIAEKKRKKAEALEQSKEDQMANFENTKDELTRL